MILGYDATTLAGHKSGVGYYTRRLLDALIAERDPALDRLLVLSNRRLSIAPTDRVEIVDRGVRVRSLWMQLELPLLLGRRRPDLVHFTNYLAPVLGGTPYVVSFHDMTLRLLPHLHTFKKRLLTAALLPRVARRARLILTPSQTSRGDVVRLLDVDPARVRVIPYAPPDDFQPSSEGPEGLARLGIRPPYLLHVGTREPRKNLPRVLRAFAQVRAAHADVRLVVAGAAGWDGGAAAAEVARLGLGPRVVFAGYVPEADLPLLYTHARGLLYPSLYEGFGLPIVEAMACGAPVITSASSSMKEIAEGAALLVDPLDEAAIATAIDRLLTDPALRGDLAARGRARAGQYSWARTARATVAAYRDALAQKL